jgi:hypothetical protein
MIKVVTVSNELTEHDNTSSKVASNSDLNRIDDGFTSYVDDPDFWEDLPLDDIAEVNWTLSIIFPVRLSCFAHSLALVVKDGIKHLSSPRPIMAKCCKLASLIHQSSLFKGQFDNVYGSFAQFQMQTRNAGAANSISCLL